MIRPLLLVLVSVVALAGCQLYWVRPGGDMAGFTADHQACVKSSALGAGQSERVMVNLDAFKSCMKSKGWKRETGSKTYNPPGYFRGIENEGPIKPDEIPEQIPTMEPPRR